MGNAGERNMQAFPRLRANGDTAWWMAENSVDLVRRAYEAWNADGLEAFAPWTAESLELEDAPQLPDAGLWRGRESVLARLAEVAATIGGTWVDIRNVRSAGDEVIVSMMWREDASPDSGELGEVFHVVRVSGGQIDRLRVFTDVASAEAAAAS
jgi:ketosteroid isomerase-like protein